MASSVTREVFVVDEMRPTPTTVFEVGQIHYPPTMSVHLMMRGRRPLVAILMNKR